MTYIVGIKLGLYLLLLPNLLMRNLSVNVFLKVGSFLLLLKTSLQPGLGGMFMDGDRGAGGHLEPRG